jgi:GNAT superfamily N-acetyltransferase
MLKIVRTNSLNQDFINLVSMLDAELKHADGADHVFYAQFNKIDNLKHVVVAYSDNKLVACGAFKQFADAVAEIKRMYVTPGDRGNGYATQVLTELENWASELNYQRTVLETGLKQPEAIALYQKSGYSSIPNYGQYRDVDNSVCFEKILLHTSSSSHSKAI